MKIRSLETFKIELPFRFAFGHALATRAESMNLIVKIILDNGCWGYGESVPRDYVTGESVTQAEDNVLLKYSKTILALNFENPFLMLKNLRLCFSELGLREKAQGASWCAVELAVLDALSRMHGKKVCDLLGERKQERIRYGGVLPFGKKKALMAMLWFYKFYGFATVKLKVGAENLDEDLDKLRLARKILGPDCIIRVDANCAWNFETAMRAAQAFKPFNVRSYEQPLPAEDWAGLQKLSASIEEDVVLDESLCTLKQAEELAKDKICNAFNVRLSKAGGILAAQEMIDIALANGLRVHLGAQVGETGILSAAARQLALCNDVMENYEGSANMFLLKKDICRENLTAGLGGFAGLKYAGKNDGLGLRVLDEQLLALTRPASEDESNFEPPPVSKNGTVSQQRVS